MTTEEEPREAPVDPPARRTWRPERRNVRALDRWIRQMYGDDAPLYG